MFKEVAFTVPFSKFQSKNTAFRYSRRGGRRYITTEHTAAREEIYYELLNSCRGTIFEKDKVWIEIFVEKPNHRFDAINWLDTVADAVKLAIKVDDHWFAVKKIDWIINKLDPKITITVSQD